MPEQLGEFAAILLAVSLASERLVVLAKTFWPGLASPGDANRPERAAEVERERRLRVMLTGMLASWLTVGFLAEGVVSFWSYVGALFVGHVEMAGKPWPVPVLGILASGGSAFWAQVVGYASAVKDVRRLERSDLEQAVRPVEGVPDGAPESIERRAVRCLVEAHGPECDFVVDGAPTETASGVRVVHLRQEREGIPVYEGALSVRFPTSGPPEARGSALEIPVDTPTVPLVSAVQAAAVALAAVQQEVLNSGSGSVRLTGADAEIIAEFPRGARPTVLTHPDLDAAIHAELVYWSDGGEVRLAWDVRLIAPEHLGEFDVVVSADLPSSPAALSLRKTEAHAVSGTVYRFTPTEGVPTESDFPPDGYPAFRDGPPPPGLGPWVEGDETEGNNVRMRRGNKVDPVVGERIGDDLRFVPGDVDGEDQRLVNAFFVCNLMHDFFLLYGFGEADGNFQETNLSGTGLGGDRLDLRVFDSSFQGIATMRSRRDGRPPRMKLGRLADRHSALDAEVLVHEFVHGVSNRLIGGASLHDPLRGKEQSEAMGEGYSDYFALTILNYFRRAEGTPENFVYGRWISGDAVNGLRNQPYSSTHGTYGLLGSDGWKAAHDAGWMWCRTLLDVRDVFATALGADLGDRLAWQVVVDSMKLLTPGSRAPTFLHGRDAIYDAFDDLVAAGMVPGSGPVLRARLVGAFGRRGMGPGAQSSGARYRDIVEEVTP